MKRRIAIILLLLAAGAVVNVAVVLAIVLTADLQRVHDPFENSLNCGGDFIGEHYIPWTVCSESQRCLRRVLSSWFRGIGGGGTGFSSGPPEPLLPAWAPNMAPTHLHSDATGVWDFLAWEVGWPLPSQGGVLAATRDDWQSPAETSCWWCIALGGERVGDPNAYLDLRLFVFRPLWPGFVINTLFYALLLWLLFIAPFTARRMILRRRGFRGLCERCAYPIGDSEVCTECGAAVGRRAHMQNELRA